jgi:hypothetical protein
MNCEELAAALGKTLIHERDASWHLEARRHADGCSSCAQLLELHAVEERLTELPAVEPSPTLLDTVMNRIAQSAPVTAQPSHGLAVDLFRYAAIYIGALILAAAYVLPAPAASWLSNSSSSPGLVRIVGFSIYFSQHPLWAIHLAALAALMILFAMAIPERPVQKSA